MELKSAVIWEEGGGGGGEGARGIVYSRNKENANWVGSYKDLGEARGIVYSRNKENANWVGSYKDLGDRCQGMIGIF